MKGCGSAECVRVDEEEHQTTDVGSLKAKEYKLLVGVVVSDVEAIYRAVVVVALAAP
jgi:hypothetical protein